MLLPASRACLLTAMMLSRRAGIDPRVRLRMDAEDDDVEQLVIAANAEVSEDIDLEEARTDPDYASHEHIDRFEDGEPKQLRFTYVDEHTCVGCYHCAMIARCTFFMEEQHGRARVFSQDGDDPELVQEAIDSCPVDCIHSVTLEALETLENERRGQTINYKKALVNSGSDQAYRAPPTEAKEMYFGIDESDPEFQEKERRLQERLADEVERQERDAQRGELVDQIFGDDGGAELVGEADPAADMEVAMGIDAYDAGVEAFAEEPTTSLCESDALNTIFSDECAIDDQVSIGICGIGMRREHRANRAHRPIATL